MDFKWLHFSDIHFNFKDYDTKKMREDLKIYLKEPKFSKKDALFFTGDFRFAPLKEYLPETPEFINALVEMFLKDSSQLYITAGNHDVDRNTTRESNILNVKNSYKSYSGTLTAIDYEYLYVGFKSFKDFTGTLGKELFDTKNPHKVFKTSKANIICLNTAIVSGLKSEVEYGQLLIGICSLEQCFEQIDKTKPTIVCGHHSLESLRYDEMIRTIELFKKYDVHIYLCGHNHVFKINNVSDDDEYKIYEIFAGNLYTENRYSQCGFVEGELSDGILILRCHEWDFNNRKWHISNTYSDKGTGEIKEIQLKPKLLPERYLDVPYVLNNGSDYLAKVLLLKQEKVAVTVPVYKKKFYEKKWKVIHYNEYLHTLDLINAMMKNYNELDITGDYKSSYPYSEIHIGGPTVNINLYRYIRNFIPSYKVFVESKNFSQIDDFVRGDFFELSEKTGFTIKGKNGETKCYYREDRKSDIGILIRLNINSQKTVHLVFGTGKRGTLAAMTFLTNHSKDIYELCGEKDYFLVMWANYSERNYSIDYSKGITNLSDIL